MHFDLYSCQVSSLWIARSTAHKLPLRPHPKGRITYSNHFVPHLVIALHDLAIIAVPLPSRLVDTTPDSPIELVLEGIGPATALRASHRDAVVIHVVQFDRYRCVYCGLGWSLASTASDGRVSAYTGQSSDSLLVFQ